MSHYTRGRRWSYIHKAWIFADQLNDEEEVARLEAENADLRTQVEALQARIDELMLEHCPDEMTQEQIDNYAKHQRPVSAEEEAAIDAATKENDNG